MTKLIFTGRGMFAIGMLGLGFLCFLFEDFIVGRPPAWPAGFSINPALAYLSGALLIIAAIGILINKKAGMGALLIALMILVFSISRELADFMNNWLNGLKSMALMGGAIITAISVFEEVPGSAPTFMSKRSVVKNLEWLSYFCLAGFFVAGAYAHFKFAGFVETFIPDYIPFRKFFTYFCAICLFAGGVGILIPSVRKWAALLSAIMVTGWFLLLHIPRFLANTNDASDRLGLCESFAIAGIFFVVAGVSAKKG